MNKIAWLMSIMMIFALGAGLCAAQSKGKSGGKKSAAKQAAKPAADKAKTEADPAKTDEAKKPDSPGSSFGNMNFDLIQADTVAYDPSGAITLDGNAVLKTDQINLACEHLKKEKDSSMMTASGSPVKIEQLPDIKAECRNLFYDTDKKSMRLEGSPVIYRTQGDSVMKTTGDIITIVQNEKGDPSVTIQKSRNSNKSSTIEMLDKNGQPKSKSKTDKPAEKVQKGNTMMIPMMSMKQPATE